MANLMINASQAMGGKGEIDISMSRQESDFICLSVRDNGPGIPEHLRSRVLEPFFTTRIDEGGTGLGLSFVYGFIKGIGGKINIAGVPDGQLGTGCSINLYIPIATSVDPETN
ncbi:MAG: sensor histidine kinase, partial [Hyphomicrobiales bacterium]